jgi:thiol-disulfide isomerase/thioredoxin
MKHLHRPNNSAVCRSLLSCFLAASTIHAAPPGRFTADELAAIYGPAFSIRVVDEQGEPVEGALAGLNCVKQSDGWVFGCNEQLSRTGADGIVELTKGGRLLPRACIVAVHESRGLAGVKFPNEGNDALPDEPQEVTIVPALRVAGHVVIRQLEQNGKAPGAFLGSFVVNDLDPFQWSSTTGDFELLLPPGEYTLHARGTYGDEVERPLRVKVGDETLQLRPIDLPATALGLLRGKPAPELRGIADWKNSDGVTIASLRGRHVLLHFWGHWCGPCIARMPALFEAHDRFPEEQLAIVSVHAGLAGEEEVDTVAELDAALAETRHGYWQGRDLPFPVALVKAEKTPHLGGATEARSRAAADFGVRSYPTTILIDPRGRIVGAADHLIDADDDFAELAEILSSGTTGATGGRGLTQPVIPVR